VQTAWNIDGDVYHALSTPHLHSTFEFSSSEGQDEVEDFASTCRPVKEALSHIHVYPKKRPASHHKREYTSTLDEGGLRLENDETWEMISI